MIITRTPLRISLVGGGTDIPGFYRTSPGAVIGGTIDKYVYVVLERRFDSRVRAVYSETEIVDRSEDLKHDIIRECLLQQGVHGGVDVVTLADVPGNGTGLGSSSALAVGLLRALAPAPSLSREWLADMACRVEIDRCHKPIGKQDQYFAAYGGFRRLRFYPNDEVDVGESLPCGENLHRHMLLFDTGVARSADDILAHHCAHHPEIDPARQLLCEMAMNAEYLTDELASGNSRQLGWLVRDNWQLKQGVTPGTTTPEIDAWCRRARDAGATGWKVLGAGGGGFLLVVAPPGVHEAVRKALADLREVPFRFVSRGTEIRYSE